MSLVSQGGILHKSKWIFLLVIPIVVFASNHYHLSRFGFWTFDSAHQLPANRQLFEARSFAAKAHGLPVSSAHVEAIEKELRNLSFAVMEMKSNSSSSRQVHSPDMASLVESQTETTTQILALNQEVRKLRSLILETENNILSKINSSVQSHSYDPASLTKLQTETSARMEALEKDTRELRQDVMEIEALQGGPPNAPASTKYENLTPFSLTPALIPSDDRQLESAKELSLGHQARILCFWHVYYMNTTQPGLEKFRSIVQMLTRILAKPGVRCDMIRFYGGKRQHGVIFKLLSEMIPPPLQRIAKVIDTEELLGPWRRRGALANPKKGKFLPGYANKFETVYRSVVHMQKAESGNFDWAVKLDLDTYFFPENFRKFLDYKGFLASDPYYLGYISLHRPRPFTTGSLFALSSKAVSLVSETIQTSLMKLPQPIQKVEPTPSAWISRLKRRTTTSPCA